jgi:hypothetical protein
VSERGILIYYNIRENNYIYDTWEEGGMVIVIVIVIVIVAVVAVVTVVVVVVLVVVLIEGQLQQLLSHREKDITAIVTDSSEECYN